MIRGVELIAFVLAGTIPAVAYGQSWCGLNYPDALLCEDFDTYCVGGGYPGSDPCPAGAEKHNVTMRRVWRFTSTNEYNDNLCGTQFNLEEDKYLAGWEPPANASPPFGVRYPCQGEATLGQQTYRDWVLSPLPPDSPGQVLNFSRLVGEKWGAQYTAVTGTDDNPLVLQFLMNAFGGDFNSGYFEVAFNEDRANTDYVYSPECATYCAPPINQGPFPIMCAQGNPTEPLPAGCPPVSQAPVRGSIAVGLLAMVDPDPCHCGSTMAHGGQNSHLVVFDGQKWLNLRMNNPRVSTGQAYPFKAITPMPPPPDISLPGSFVVSTGRNYSVARAYNWVTLRIKSTTFDVEMTTLEQSSLGNDYQYWIQSIMTDIPRPYTGPFNTMRAGVGGGCPLDSNTSWTRCDFNPTGRSRNCIRSLQRSAGSVFFNDLVLRGGAPYSLEGACCLPDAAASCSEMLQVDCESTGGTWRGPSTTCSTLARPCCPKTYGDNNYDGFVDMTDFAALQTCLTSGVVTMDPSCICLDVNSDGRIDAADLERFITCAQGPAVPGNTGTAGDPPVSCLGVGW